MYVIVQDTVLLLVCICGIADIEIVRYIHMYIYLASGWLRRPDYAGPSLSIADCAFPYEFTDHLRSLLRSVRISDEVLYPFPGFNSIWPSPHNAFRDQSS